VRALRVGGAQARWSFLSVAIVSILSGFAGCTATIPRQPHTETAPPTEAIYVIAGGWHTELGLPVTAITGSLAALKPGFGGARYLVFGWGAHDYYMSQNPSIGDLLRAAASGPAVILVIPLESRRRRSSVLPTCLPCRCRRKARNASHNFCGTIWPWTRKGIHIPSAPVLIRGASFLLLPGPTISAIPAIHGRPKLCMLPAYR